MKKGYILRNAAQVVTVSGTAPKKGSMMSDVGVIENATVVIEGDVITLVGPTEEILSAVDKSDYEVIDCEGKTITPGFVDSHTHLVFGGYRENEYDWRLKGVSYVDIMNRGGGIANSVTATKDESFESLVQSGLKRLKSMASFGVTTVEGKSGYGLDKDTEIKQLEVMKKLSELQSVEIIPTFLGPHSCPKEYKGREDEFIKYMVDEVLPVVKVKNLAKFVDIFTEKNVFEIKPTEIYLEGAKKLGFGLKMHADEIFPLGGSEIAAKHGCISADHLLQISDAGIEALEKAGTIATLLPITAFSLKEHYAPARKLIDSGCAVALATDFNPGSCFSESIPLLIALSTLYMGMSIEEVISALTINGAAAVGKENEVGSIQPGKKADILIHEFPSYKFLPYHIGVSTVEITMKNGRIIYKR